MKDCLEIQFWKIAKWLIRRGYGANCETRDIDDFPGEDLSNARCPGCEAKETIEWIEEHIKQLNYE